MNSHVWVEVSVNIGQRCLKIEIQRNESIEDVVSRFINTNRLSSKYEPIITNMIKDEIKKRINSQQAENNIQKSSTNSVASSMNSKINQSVVNQSFLNKQNALLSQVLKIQEETNRKRNLKLAELRQHSQSKSFIQSCDKEPENTGRPSFKKTQIQKQKYKLQQTPQMAVDTSRQSSAQYLNSFNQSQSQDQSNCSNQFSRVTLEQQQNQIKQSKQITENIAELKQLLSTNQAYNSHNSHRSRNSFTSHQRSSQQPITWVSNKDAAQKCKSQRLKTQTPQNIYERWKKLQQVKRLESQSRNVKTKKPEEKSKSPLVKREDNFFYNKGKSFLETKNKKIQTKFNEIYPFKTSKTPQNSKTGVQTSERLFKQSKQYFSKKLVKPKHVDLDLSLKADPIREKMRKRDNEQDSIFNQLVDQGAIKSPVMIKYKQKSPFRRTIVFN